MTFYDNPSRHIYTYDQVNLAAAFTRTIVGPFNKRGRIISLAGQVSVSTSGAQAVATITGTAPNVQISPSTPNTNAAPLDFNYPIPLAAAPAGFSSDTSQAASQRDANNFLPILPANTPIVFRDRAWGRGHGGPRTRHRLVLRPCRIPSRRSFGRAIPIRPTTKPSRPRFMRAATGSHARAIPSLSAPTGTTPTIATFGGSRLRSPTTSRTWLGTRRSRGG